MKTYTLYDIKTGKIKGSAYGDRFTCGDLGMLECKTIGEPNLEWVNPQTNLLEHRPTFPISIDKTEIVSDVKDTATITGIPENTICTYEGTDHVVTGGKILFVADHAGDYVLSFSLFPYIDMSLTITAKAAQQ